MTLFGAGRTGAICLIATLFGLNSYVNGQSPAAAGPQRLAAAARAAKSQFRPVTKADADEALARFSAAVAQLDERLVGAGNKGEHWKSYLQWDDIQAQLHRPAGPDTAVLGPIYAKFASGNEGLELKWFALVRQAMRQYLEVAGAVDNPDVKTAVGEHLDLLAQQLESWATQPTTDNAHQIAETLAWIDTARQVPDLVQSVRSEFGRPNFSGHVVGSVVGLGIAGPVDETAPVDDVIMDTVIHGTGRTVGQTEVRLVPDSNCGVFDTVLLATNSSRNVGQHAPVCIYSCATTCIGACKRFWIDAFGLHVYPAISQANAQSTILDIKAMNGSRLIEWFAWRRAEKQESEADAIASQHAQWHVNARIDEQAVSAVEQANANYETKVRRPLGDRLIFPQQLGFSTDQETIQLSGLGAAADQLAAPTAAPALALHAEMALSVHESMPNNLAATVLGGMRLTDDMLQRTLKDLLGQMPERLKPDADQEPFTIVFARQQPITVSFGDNGFSVTIRGREFLTGERSHPAMNITATYKFVKTDLGFKAVRQGDLDIFAPGTLPGSGKQRGLRQQAIWTVLQHRFGKVFEPEIVMKGFTLSGKFASGRFVPVEIRAENGWLAVGWNRAAAAPTATASSD